jgi:hypothetical protein
MPHEMALETNLDLPQDPVTMSLVYNRPTSTFSTILSNVPSDYAVTNGNYIGWCADPDTWIPMSTPLQVILYSSYNTTLPSHLQNTEWDKINYLINHKQGNPTSWLYCWDIQFAIWYLLGYSDRGTQFIGAPMSSTAWAMVNDANTNGEGFIPQTDELIIILVDAGPTVQGTFFEIPVPIKYEGLTPGFWKNHPEEWVGYTPSQTIDSVFEIPTELTPIESLTLNSALNLPALPGLSGAALILLKHAIAAILNAAHPDINYPIPEATDIIEQVNVALASLNRKTMLTLKNTLETYNELGGEFL